MRSIFIAAAFVPTLFGILALSGCATEDYAADLSKPNFGRLQLISGDTVDARVLTNGAYSASPHAITPYASSCVTTSVGCLQRTQSSWTSFDP
jgi:hypothetical protein